MSLYFDFGRSTDVFKCFRIAEGEREAWVAAAEELFTNLEDRHGDYRELVIVNDHRGSDSRYRLAFVEEMSPEALAAAKAFFCRVHEAFGKKAERAIRETVPLLMVRFGFPSTCGAHSEVRGEGGES
ncbi:MAG: hypothetical protein D6696_13350 [Acidobacteria bacterium]|nr:MAG: hypothetical protein D6696_13350 [Acidobacteriota bacterium]